MNKQYIFKALKNDPCLAFFGSDDEIAKQEKKENEVINQLEKIFFSSSFVAASFSVDGRLRVVGPSLYGYMLQVSYFDKMGLAVMHENIKNNPVSKRDFLYNIALNCFSENDLIIDVMQ